MPCTTLKKRGIVTDIPPYLIIIISHTYIWYIKNIVIQKKNYIRC